MKVTILGPNLPGSLQKKGQFHVHRDGCQHLYRTPLRYVDDGESGIEVTTRLEAAEYIYPRGEFEWTREEDYIDDLYFAPCVKALPTRAA
jgi:hypothetical protein